MKKREILKYLQGQNIDYINNYNMCVIIFFYNTDITIHTCTSLFYERLGTSYLM